jgi:multiple antibiotic resistance protein
MPFLTRSTSKRAVTLQDWFSRAIFWIVVIDPIGTLPVFIGMTRRLSPERRQRVASKAILIASLVLLAYVAVGQLLLTALHVSVPAFQLAGAVILFLLGLRMVFETEAESHDLHEEPGHDIAVFPLAIPSLAGPGAVMAAIVMTQDGQFSPAEQFGNTGLMIATLLLTRLLFRFAEPIQKALGETGANVISRVMGMILCALAVQSMVDSLRALIG